MPAPTPDVSTPPTLATVVALLEAPLLDLVHRAAIVHRQHHDPRVIQRSQLLSIKTGGCSEDCGYCAQSAQHETGLPRQELMSVDDVVSEARSARDGGADRFCLGAAWRGVRDGPEFDRVLSMVAAVKALGLETCATLGMLTADQAERLAEVGLDYYNHNLDTGESHYDAVVGTHDLADRLDTLDSVRAAGMKLCCGGILGLGEDRAARAELLLQLAMLDPVPESVPINTLVPVEGTPMAGHEPVDWTEVVATVAAARILMPGTSVRLSAGRSEMPEAVQAMCFLSGANSLFVGDRLLTTGNPERDADEDLLGRLGLQSIA